MWAGDHRPYEGKHYRLAEPINSPQPLTKPQPPILIGGAGEKKILRASVPKSIAFFHMTALNRSS